jgi:hypothetical protein
MTNPFAPPSGVGPASSRQADVDEADSFISTSNKPLQFPAVGFKVGGTILDYGFRDDLKDGERQWWVGKDLVKENELAARGRTSTAGLQLNRVLLFDLQLHDENLRGRAWKGLTYQPVQLPDDDLLRTAWVRSDMKKALQRALKDAGCAVEGWIAKSVGAYVEWTRLEDGIQRNAQRQAPHRFNCIWVPREKNPYQQAASLADGPGDPWAQSAPAQTVPATGPSPWDSAPAAATPRSEPPF